MSVFVSTYVCVCVCILALQKLHDEVRQKAESWLNWLPTVHRMHIHQQMGDIPAVEPSPLTMVDGPVWLWWLVSVLPLHSRTQISFIAMLSLHDRLTAAQHMLTLVQRKGWSERLADRLLTNPWTVLLLIGILLTLLVQGFGYLFLSDSENSDSGNNGNVTMVNADATL